MYQFAATDLRMNTIYIQVYVVWMKFIFVEMFPYIIIIVLNALIILRWVQFCNKALEVLK